MAKAVTRRLGRIVLYTQALLWWGAVHSRGQEEPQKKEPEAQKEGEKKEPAKPKSESHNYTLTVIVLATAQPVETAVGSASVRVSYGTQEQTKPAESGSVRRTGILVSPPPNP